MAVKTNYDYISIVNAINASVGGMYNYTFPLIDNDNFKSMAAVLSDAPLSIQNAWIDVLMNVAFNTVIKRVYPALNPFRYLYGDEVGLDGEDSQYTREVAIDRIIPLAYEKCGGADTFFGCKPPMIRVQYLYNVLRSKYIVSVTFDLLISAFRNYNEFGRFYDGITERLMYDMEHDDIEAIMAMINGVIEGGNIYLVPLARPVDSSTALNFSKTLGVMQTDLSLKRSRRYNMNRLSTSTRKDMAVLLVTADVIETENKYNVAWAFDKGALELLQDGRLIETASDGFAGNKVYAIYTDRDFLKINNILGFPKMKRWENPDDLSEKRWLHNWKRFCVSYFSNAIAFADPGSIGVSSVEIITKNGESSVKKGGFLLMDLAKVTPVEGKIADAVVTYSMEGATDPNTSIDPESGDIYVGKDETATELTIKAVSHLDDTKTGTKVISVKQ